MVYDNVIRICESKGITVFALEKKAELGNGTIRSWKESNPTVTTLSKVALALDVPISELLKERSGN